VGGIVRGRHPTVLEGSGTISTEAVGVEIAAPAAAAVAVVTAYSMARFESRTFPSLGISGVDIHKVDRPVRAEMGGLAVLLAMALASSLFLGLEYSEDGSAVLFAAVAATVAFTGLVGVADDMLEISQKLKPFLIVVASVPLMFYLSQRAFIFVPLLGSVHLGLLYPLIAVPLAITTSANFSNLLAGFNGLEAGCASISLGTMSVLSYAYGHPTVAVLGVIMTFAYVGFLALNWYPAKIFPGDSGTLMAGAALAAMGLASGLEFEAIVLSVPAAMDFGLKMMYRRPFKQRHVLGNTKVREDGTLDPAPYPALVHAFMKVSPIGEKGLVLSVLATEVLFAVAAVAVAVAFL